MGHLLLVRLLLYVLELRVNTNHTLLLTPSPPTPRSVLLAKPPGALYRPAQQRPTSCRLPKYEAL